MHLHVLLNLWGLLHQAWKPAQPWEVQGLDRGESVKRESDDGGSDVGEADVVTSSAQRLEKAVILAKMMTNILEC